MDVVYDFVESVHIFIPIVAVVFIVLVIFVCGTSGRDKQPDQAYLTKLNELDVQQRKERKAQRASTASKPLPVSRPAQSASDTVRQRKNKKATDSPVKSPKRADSFNESPEIHEQDDGWVTVTPKRNKVRTQKDAWSQDDADTHREHVHSKEIEADDDVVEDVAEVVIADEAVTGTGAAQAKETIESVDDSAQSKQKQSRKKQQAQSKKHEPAFVIEEPVLTEDKSSPVVDDSNAHRSGESIVEQHSTAEPSQEEQQGSDSEDGEGDGEGDDWTTPGEKKKRKKKKSKKALASKSAAPEAADDSPTRADNSEDDDVGDLSSFSPVESRKKRRPRRE